MGTASSKTAAEVIYATNRKVKKSESDFRTIGLSEDDVAQLHKNFKKMDVDESDEIALIELFTVVKVDSTRFNQRVFKVFDTDNSACINFREFVVAMWNFCTLSKTTIVDFIFQMYDADGSGILSVPECVEIVKDIYGNRFESSMLAKKLTHKLQTEVKHDLDLESFRALSKKHSAMLYPAFSLKVTFREKVVGDKFWINLEKARSAKYGNIYWPPAIILKFDGDVSKMQADLDFRRMVDENEAQQKETIDKQKQAKAERLSSKKSKQKRRGSFINMIRASSKDLTGLVRSLSSRKRKHETQKRRVSIFTHLYDGKIQVDSKKKGEKAPARSNKAQTHKIAVSAKAKNVLEVGEKKNAENDVLDF